MRYIGVDGCPDGWIAVKYRNNDFREAFFYEMIEHLWEEHRDAERIPIDVPIGPHEDSNEPRLCDTVAREVLSAVSTLTVRVGNLWTNMSVTICYSDRVQELEDEFSTSVLSKELNISP